MSALGLDPSGARLVTGGYDYDVKFWDFAGMDASFKAFRSLQPCEWYVFAYLISSYLLNIFTLEDSAFGFGIPSTMTCIKIYCLHNLNEVK